MTMSQDEINAMLSGLDAGENAPDEAQDMPEGDAREELVVDIPADVMTGDDAGDSGASEHADLSEYQLTSDETDIMGEIGNICMGSVATTLFTLLDRRVSITTPKVSIHTTKEVLNMYTTPFVVVSVEYVEGIDGKNLLLLKEYDAALITDLLLGGDGNIEEPIELTDIHMSAISEIMNQMIGASATAMSKILSKTVNISPPVSVRIDENSDVSAFLDETTVIVKVSFDMEIEGLLSSQLLQMIPFGLAKDIVAGVKSSDSGMLDHALAEAPPEITPKPAEEAPVPEKSAAKVAEEAPPAPPAAYPEPPVAPQPGNLVDVHTVQFQSFEQPAKPAAAINTTGIDLVQDIPLQVTVELGRTKKNISEILDFGSGTVLVLDKNAGEPVEILVNGKLIAHGEVVVIEENYGVRITEIVN